MNIKDRIIAVVLAILLLAACGSEHESRPSPRQQLDCDAIDYATWTLNIDVPVGDRTLAAGTKVRVLAPTHVTAIDEIDTSTYTLLYNGDEQQLTFEETLDVMGAACRRVKRLLPSSTPVYPSPAAAGAGRDARRLGAGDGLTPVAVIGSLPPLDAIQTPNGTERFVQMRDLQ